MSASDFRALAALSKQRLLGLDWPKMKNCLDVLNPAQLWLEETRGASSIGGLALQLVAELAGGAERLRRSAGVEAPAENAARTVGQYADLRELGGAVEAAFAGAASAMETAAASGTSLYELNRLTANTGYLLGQIVDRTGRLTSRLHLVAPDGPGEEALQAFVAAESTALRYRYSEELSIGALAANEHRPYDLLLSADPSRELVDEYLARGDCFVARLNGEIVGEYVLIRTHPQTIEIVNVAVKDEYQGRGIGAALVADAIDRSKRMNARTLEVGTGSTGLAQLGLYQKCGFRVFAVERDFFVRHYEEALFENGLQVRDMVRLRVEL